MRMGVKGLEVSFFGSIFFIHNFGLADGKVDVLELPVDKV